MKSASVANGDWNRWLTREMHQVRAYLEAYYLENQPRNLSDPVSVHHRDIVEWCRAASRAAGREGVATKTERLTAIRAHGISTGGKETFDYLFPR